ncbi:MAG: glycosyltransferase family 29 protein [Caldilineaceae bacterium]
MQTHADDLIIVGSGQSLQGSELGESIDSFGRVLRFKGYEYGIGQFDEDVGRKCTDLFVNGNIHAMRDLVQKVAAGELPSGISTVHYGYDNRLYLEEFLALQTLFAAKQINLSYLPCREYLPTLNSHLPWHKSATSGLSVVYHFIRMQDVHADYNIGYFSKIFLVGFDAVANPDAKPIRSSGLPHYYARTDVEKATKRPIFYRKHDLRAEAQLIKEWLAAGKIHLLNPSAC